MPKSFSNNGPRSVIDPDADDYDEMIRKHRADVAAPEAGATAPVATSTTSDKRVANPVTEGLNFAREGRKKWENGQYIQAVGDAAEGIGNLIVTVDTLSGISKGGLKLKGPFVWRTKPWEEAGARKWLGEKASSNLGNTAIMRSFQTMDGVRPFLTGSRISRSISKGWKAQHSTAEFMAATKAHRSSMPWNAIGMVRLSGGRR